MLKASVAPSVTPSNKSLLTGPALILLPGLLVQGMSISAALLLQQIYYWSKRTVLRDDKGRPVICYTYEDWHRQLPFLTTRWIKALMRQHEKDGWIVVERGSAYNRYSMSDALVEEFGNIFGNRLLFDNEAPIKVFPSLVHSLGIVEAVVLQTIHIRTYKNSDWWVKKSVREWHDNLLPFVATRTLERALRRLENLGAVLTENSITKGRSSKRRRVNYVRLAKIMSIELEASPPKLHALTVISSPLAANCSTFSADSSPLPDISSSLA